MREEARRIFSGFSFPFSQVSCTSSDRPRVAIRLHNGARSRLVEHLHSLQLVVDGKFLSLFCVNRPFSVVCLSCDTRQRKLIANSITTTTTTASFRLTWSLFFLLPSLISGISSPQFAQTAWSHFSTEECQQLEVWFHREQKLVSASDVEVDTNSHFHCSDDIIGSLSGSRVDVHGTLRKRHKQLISSGSVPCHYP